MFIDDEKTVITFWDTRFEDLKFSQLFSNMEEVRFYDLATGKMMRQLKKPFLNPFGPRLGPTGKTTTITRIRSIIVAN
jgi:hypothetical protein